MNVSTRFVLINPVTDLGNHLIYRWRINTILLTDDRMGRVDMRRQIVPHAYSDAVMRIGGKGRFSLLFCAVPWASLVGCCRSFGAAPSCKVFCRAIFNKDSPKDFSFSFTRILRNSR